MSDQYYHYNVIKEAFCKLPPDQAVSLWVMILDGQNDMASDIIYRHVTNYAESLDKADDEKC